MKRAFEKLFFIVTCLYGMDVHTVFALQVGEDSIRSKVASVEISGMRDQDWKPYRVFLRGLDAYDANRHLAPDTEFRYILRPQTEDIELQKTELRIVGESVVVQVPLSDDGTFALPRNRQAYIENAELVLNQKQHRMRWNLKAIRTKGLPENRRRMGDLRLTCEVFAAMEDWDRLRHQLRLGSVNADNACISPRLNWTFYEARRLVSAVLFNERRVEALQLTPDRYGFVIPLFDQFWSNQALIRLEFEASNEKLQ